MGLLSFLRRKRQPERIVITEESVTRIRPDGVQESVRWGDLVEVGIVTTDEGPYSEDVFFLLLTSAREAGCVVPQGAEGAEALLGHLQRLPGFDNEAVIKAMGCTSNARFVCWRKPPQADIAGPV
jgi:hypothetical protein